MNKNPFCLIRVMVFCILAILFTMIGCFMFNANHEMIFFQKSGLFAFHLIWFLAIIAFWVFNGFIQLPSNINHGAIRFNAIKLKGLTALVSLFVLLISFFIPRDVFGLLSVILSTFQIIIVIVYIIVTNSLLTTVKMQTKGVDKISSDYPHIDELIMELESFEKKLSLSDSDKKNLKQLKEQLKYSIPNRGKIAKATNYATLVADIGNLLEKVGQGRATEQDFFVVSQDISRLKIECKNNA